MEEKYAKLKITQNHTFSLVFGAYVILCDGINQYYSETHSDPIGIFGTEHKTISKPSISFFLVVLGFFSIS